MQEVYFKNIRDKIIDLLDQSKFEIKVAVAWVTDAQIIKSLEQAQKRGVNITIIFYKDKINKIEMFEKLFMLGGNILTAQKLMHNKFCIIDNEMVINGSFNWTWNAGTNDENIVVSVKNYNLINEFEKEFNRILEKSESIECYLTYTNKSILDEDVKFNNYYQSSIIYKYSKGVGYPYWYLDSNTLVFIDNEEVEFKYFRKRHFKMLSYKLFKIQNRSYLEDINYRKRSNYLRSVETITNADFKIENLFVLNEVEDLFSSDGVVTLFKNFEVVHYQKEIFKEKEKFVSLVNIKNKQIIQQYKLVNVYKINQSIISNGKQYNFKEKLYQVVINNENYLLDCQFDTQIRTTFKIILVFDFGVLVELDKNFINSKFENSPEIKLYKIMLYLDKLENIAIDQDLIYCDLKIDNNEIYLIEYQSKREIKLILK